MASGLVADDIKDKRSNTIFLLSLRASGRDDAGKAREVGEEIVDVRAGPGAEQSDGAGTSVQPGQVLPLKLLPRVPALPGELGREGRRQGPDLGRRMVTR